MSDEQSVDQVIQEMATALERGVDVYQVVGKLYLEILAKNQAIGLAVQALQALKPVEPDVTPEGFAPAGPEPPHTPTEPTTEEGAQA
jgi:hypothetical protein